MPERYVRVLWCDDIRQEIGNKISFMGVYTNGIVVQSLPNVLLRLSLYVWVSTDIDNPFKKLSLKVKRDDEFVLAEIPTNNFEQPIANMDTNPIFKRVEVMFGLNLGGVEIPDGCKYFTVEVETESEILEGAKLLVNVDSGLI